MSRTRILVTGGGGQLGTAIRAAANRFDVEVHAPGRDVLDLGKSESIEAMVAASDWGAILNAAAYTAVDKAESEPDLAVAINAVAPGVLARAAAKQDIFLLHVSTDYVFDGAKDGFYNEDDTVAPLGVYGQSKAEGECAVRDARGPHIVLRTAWLMSPTRSNFVKTMLSLGAQRDTLSIVDDQLGCPTSADDVATTLLTLALRGVSGSCTLHFVNGGEASWFDLARFVFDRAKAAGHTTPALSPISSIAYQTPAKRPANSRLSTARIAERYGIHPRHWREAIGDVVDTLLSSDGVAS